MKKKLLKSNLWNVDISDVDLKPGPFCMSYNFTLESIKASIEKFGVLNPPYLLTKPGSNFIVVAGYRRLLAIRELGWQDTVCQILPDNFSPLKALLLNLNDNLIHRQLNNIEKGMILQRLTGHFKREEIVSSFMPVLDLPANRQTLELFLDLEEIEEAIKVSVATERLSLRIADLMRGMSRDDRLKINDLFTSLKWGFNRQWETIQWIIEIASREGRSIKEVIGDRQIAEISNNDRMNNPQKVKAIVKILKVRRFPSILKAEKAFKTGLSNLSLPPGVRIIPPPFFEGIDCRLEIVFTKGEELREKLTELSDLSGLEKVIDFLKGVERG